MANWKPPAQVGRARDTWGPEEPQRDLRVATRWRCGSGDSGRCPTPAPKTWDPGRTGPPATELPLEKDSTPSEQKGCRGRSPRPVPLEPLSPPSSIRAAARRPPPGAPRPAASPGLRSGQHRGFSLPAVPSSFPLGSSPARPASPSPLLTAQPFYLL